MDKNIFHVHTKRCCHASNETDEAYIKKAIELGARSITFTDHAPFPGDPFGNRMRYNQLGEYVESLKTLRNKYEKDISVKIGLEIEFLPSYIEYYQELKRSNEFDVLVLGQHFYETNPGRYSFSQNLIEMRAKEFVGCGKAIIDGVDTGLFDVVAHPDRIFRRRMRWNARMEEVAGNIINAARKNGVLLEKNESSKHRKYCYWKEFWKMAPSEAVIDGIDAHSVQELK